jgi:hypothetical protein
MSPVWYELGFYIQEDAILHSDSRENLNSYIFIYLSACSLTSAAYVRDLSASQQRTAECYDFKWFGSSGRCLIDDYPGFCLKRVRKIKPKNHGQN